MTNISLLQKQYDLLRGSRGVMLDFIATQVGEALTTPVPEFVNKTIAHQLVHVANVYIHWLANFAMIQGVPIYDEATITDIEQIRGLFKQADMVMAAFLQQFTDNLDEPITNLLPGDRKVTTTPLELFTHVLTHEFHHKGQVMTMCRLLGNKPGDTDVIRF